MAKSWKEYEHSNPVEEISVSLYLESWYHNGGSPYEIMDTGIRMRLFNAGGTNYANYSYWLACWSGSSNNRSAPDQYTRVVYGIGDLPTGSWKNILLYPSIDWPGIDWDSCSEVRFELYVTTNWAYLDYLNIYYDNFVHNDFAKDAKTLYSYNKPTGNLLSSTDSLGYTTSQQYDAIGRIVRINNSDSSYRTMVYSDTNNNVTLFDELGHKTITYFDKIGRVVKVERWGDGTSAYSWTTSGYNWQDQVSTHADEMGHVTKNVFDYLGRLTRTTNPDLSYTTVAYDDVNRVVTSCAYTSGGVLTHKSVMVKDVLGRLNATREYTTSANYNETLMTYDAVGDLLTVRDPKGQVTRMTYDSLNRVTRTTYPDSLYESATYDAAGRTLTKTDREGNVTTSLYDSAGNLVKTVSPTGTVSRLYDAAGQLACIWNNSAGASQGATWYYYNGRGWMTTQYDLIDGTWYTTWYGYDVEGRQTYVWSPPLMQFDYAYDGYDRVSTVRKHSDGSLLMTVTYNKDDTMASETTGDGTKVTTYSYNSRDWVSSMVMKLSGTTKLVLLYQYDEVGNVKQLVVNTTGNPNQAKTETYTYDWLDRIRSASGGNLPSGLTYAYDAAGNAVTFAGKTCTYGSYNKLTGDGTWGYTYDGNGNLAWKTKSNEKWNYQFNSQDQLTKAVKGTKSGQTWTYTTQGEYWYNPNGMMAKSVQGGTTTYYVYRGHDPLMEKTGSSYTFYAYANGRMFAKIVGTDTYYYIRDALGSTRQVWQHGQTSATFSVATYKPFGTPVSPSGAEKFQYAGEMIVSAAGTSPGLYYIGARWMDPELGRWISLDPELGRLSSPQTMNRYVYCGDNPLRFVDPTGHWFWVAIGAAVGAIVNTAIYLATTDNPTLEGALGAAASGAITGAVAAATFGVGTIASRAISGGVNAGVSMAVYAGGQLLSDQKITAQGLAASAAGGFVAGFIGGGKQVSSLLSIKSLGTKASTMAWEKAGIRVLGNNALLAGVGARFAVKGSLGVTSALVGAGVSALTQDPNDPRMTDRELGWSFLGSGAAGLASDPWTGPPRGGAGAQIEQAFWSSMGGVMKKLGLASFS
jgi:RHS repeat-associated protein